MPGFDGTGPLGQGPGTGRGLGPCGAGVRWFPRFWGRGFGFGRGRGFAFGRGRGFGRGWGRGFCRRFWW